MIVRFKDIKEWITSIIKDQILLSIFFTIMINIVPVICILIHADLIDSFSWQVYLIVNTITSGLIKPTEGTVSIGNIVLGEDIDNIVDKKFKVDCGRVYEVES
ncbi:MAG: hypothetical protein E7214_16065 [Clostridium sp.]|nr:hypothetical protein [Clostridium sp.]